MRCWPKLNKTAFPDPCVFLCVFVHLLLDPLLSLQELQAVYLEGEVEKTDPGKDEREEEKP